MKVGPKQWTQPRNDNAFSSVHSCPPNSKQFIALKTDSDVIEFLYKDRKPFGAFFLISRIWKWFEFCGCHCNLKTSTAALVFGNFPQDNFALCVNNPHCYILCVSHKFFVKCASNKISLNFPQLLFAFLCDSKILWRWHWKTKKKTAWAATLLVRCSNPIVKQFTFG